MMRLAPRANTSNAAVVATVLPLSSPGSSSRCALRCLSTPASSSSSSFFAHSRNARRAARGGHSAATRISRGVPAPHAGARQREGGAALRTEATAAFHAFLRQQNSPYVSATAAAAAAAESHAPPPPQLQGEGPHFREVSAAAAAPPLPSVEDHREGLRSSSESALREWSVNPPTPFPTAATADAAGDTQVERNPQRSQKGSRTPHVKEQRRRYAVIEEAHRSTAQQLLQRHRRVYERDFLHAYQLLKKVEGMMYTWSQQRRRRGQELEPVGRVDVELDVVEGRCFEYAGQVQRTLHQLTPAHFEAMRDSRLCRVRRDKAAQHSTSSAPLPRLHIRLLWRLLHITELFYAIGRQASLPRGAVQSYVRSANCAYGIREVLRVLGNELALTAAVGLPQSSISPADTLSRDELFQIFYAVLCIPSAEAPGVPIYDPTALRAETGRGGASSQPSLLAFQRDCVATGATPARMPLDEWCVRWWCHCYDEQRNTVPTATDTSAVGETARMSALLSMGQAMDVVRAALYATAETEATATSSPSASSSFVAAAATPFSYFETPPRGVGNSLKTSRLPQRSNKDDDSAVDSSSAPSTTRERGQLRRYRPNLAGALGGDRTALRIPYHLGRRFVTSFLLHLLSASGEKKAGGGDTAAVEAAMQRLLRRPDRDAVRDVALLCTAILYFEVFSAHTATFMARAAPLCREQAELLSGQEISCVLLAYATLQRWESAKVEATHFRDGEMRSDRHDRSGDLAVTTVRVQSASSAMAQPRSAAHCAAPSSSSSFAATGGSTAATDSSPQQQQQRQQQQMRRHNDAAGGQTPRGGGTRRPSHSFSSQFQHGGSAADSSTASWHLFYVTLASRAGQLGDTLSEEDVTRVLRAMELVGMEHRDLRRALESSLRMRNLGRRVLYET